MAQTLIASQPSGIGTSARLKFAVLRLNNSAAETAYTLTAALAGMTAILYVGASDESAAAAVRVNPTVDAGMGPGFYTQVALTFTAGDELTLLVVGV